MHVEGYGHSRAFVCKRTIIVNMKYAKLLPVGFAVRVLAEPQSLVCLAVCLTV